MNLLLQSESAECGLACLAMVANHHGQQTDLYSLRQKFSVSLRGATLAQLMRHAASMGFTTRPLRLELEDLTQLQTPAILHWNLNHFVVLEKASKDNITILDPAVGRRKLALTEVSKSFTGVALELTPNAEFKADESGRRVRLRDLTGKVVGLKRAMFNILLMALGLQALALLSPLATQFVVDGALVTGDRDLLLLVVVGAGLLALTDFAIRVARGWVGMRINQSWSMQWSGNVLAHLLKLPMSYFEKRHLGDITSRFGALSAIRSALTGAMVDSVLDGIMAITTLALMLMYSPKLTAVAVSAVALYGLLRWLSYAPLREASAERMVLAAKEQSYFLETIRAVQPIKLYGRESERLGRWQNLLVDVMNRDVRTQKLALWFKSGNTLIFALESAFILYLGGLAVLDHQLSLGMLLAFMAYKSQFAGRASSLIDIGIELKMLSLHAERLADIVLEPPEVEAQMEVDMTKLVPSIELKNVSFRYAEGEPWVLRHVNLKIEAGEAVALIGGSGSGKTTLLKIMLGLLPVTEGEVLIGGHSLRLLGLSQVRQIVGTVMQDDALLAGSIAENISVFDVAPKQDIIERTAMLAAIHGDIMKMPMGYQTLMGDMGNSLSGGQRQRVLLARALYKTPKILALDEATSHLDVENERMVNHAIASLPLTRIVIAHRPETIASLPRIIELRHGVERTEVMEHRAMTQSVPLAGVA